tara:strand:- start:856 stop:1044 length:189 start_codon:yes stop_codon:yes gene_type:complete
MNVGDLVKVTSASRPIVTEVGIFLGMARDWKEWYRILVKGNEQRYDEPFWVIEVISEKSLTL